MSTSAYRALSNFIALPSERTFCDYTHVRKATSGVSYSVTDRMKEDMDFESGTTDAEKMIGILLDEMKVKSGLVFNKPSGRLVGFANLTSLNSDLEAMERSLNHETSHDQPAELAGNMLVLMARQILKPSSTFPVAQYPTASLSGEKLYPILWDVIEAMELSKFKVLYVTCDGLLANRKLFQISHDVALLWLNFKCNDHVHCI